MVQPKINFNIQSNFNLNGGTPFASAALIGTASWGEESVVKDFSSFGDIKNYYKTGTVVDGAEKFFLTGGRSLRVYRVVDGTNQLAATKNFTNTATNVLSISGKYKGSYGNGISVTITTNGSNRDVKITDGVVVENYLDLATNGAIVSAINTNSNLAVAAVLGGYTSTLLVDAITATYLLSGNDGTSALDNADYTTVLSDVLWLKDWDYLIIPGKTDDSLHTSISTLLDIRASEENKFSIYVTGVTKFESISTAIARTSTNINGKLVVVHSALYNGILTPDTDVDTNNYLDASYTACAYAGVLCRLPVNTSPTFKSFGAYAVNSLTNTEYTRDERETLIAAGFTIVTKTFTDDYGVYMGVTRNGDSTKWNFMLDNVRKVHYMAESIYETVKGYIGQPNDKNTRTSMKGSVSGFLRSVVDDRIIESYVVEVDKGVDPRAVVINTDVLLINETDYIDINLVLNV